ncbi:MAG: phosphoribosylglycinamide formyltransferase [Candidatus Kapaibacterium sp.]
MLRLAVFASGQGSNLEAIYHSISRGALHDVELALVISNNSASGALSFARKREIPGIHLSVLSCENDKLKFESKLLLTLQDAKIDLIALAGYMKKLPGKVLEEYAGRIVNIHPALLPEFGGKGMYGMNVHAAVLASGAKISGASAHFVEGEYDTGEIILQETCPVIQGETPESLAERVKEIEHRILPKAIQVIANRVNKGK